MMNMILPVNHNFTTCSIAIRGIDPVKLWPLRTNWLHVRFSVMRISHKINLCLETSIVKKKRNRNAYPENHSTKMFTAEQ